jgi:hypothetical protein
LCGTFHRFGPLKNILVVSDGKVMHVQEIVSLTAVNFPNALNAVLKVCIRLLNIVTNA